MVIKVADTLPDAILKIILSSGSVRLFWHRLEDRTSRARGTPLYTECPSLTFGLEAVAAPRSNALPRSPSSYSGCTHRAFSRRIFFHL